MSTIKTINLGTANTGDGDPLRSGGSDINDNFQALNVEKLETGGYAGTAQDLEDAIGNIDTTGFVTINTFQEITSRKSFLGGLTSPDIKIGNDLNIEFANITLAVGVVGFTGNVVIGTTTLQFIKGVFYNAIQP